MKKNVQKFTGHISPTIDQLNRNNNVSNTSHIVHQLHLQDGRNRPAYTAHEYVHEYIKTHSKQHLVRQTFDLEIEPIHGHSSLCRARPVNIDVVLEDIMWIRGLGRERLPTASYALRPNLNLVYI